MKVVNAIEYLKNNNFDKSESYEWINPILKKVLNDDLKNEDIEKLICSIIKTDKPDENKASLEISATTNKNETCNELQILGIKEISRVKNYGLVDLKEPISLNEGLNVFYGKNGVGKSSLYKALCNSLGLESPNRCVPNINSKDNNMGYRLKFLDSNNQEQIIDSSNSKISNTNVKIFDNYISNFIVNNDQENEFEIPYLKQQYFYVIRDLLEEISNMLKEEENKISSKTNDVKEILKNDIDFLDKSHKDIKKIIKDVSFSERDSKELEELNNKKVLYELNASQMLTKPYKDRLKEIDIILEKLCCNNLLEEKRDYCFKYNDKFFLNYNSKLIDLLKFKKLYESNNKKNLSNYIPESWIGNEEWDTFIEAGIKFVQALTEEERFEYSKNKCPYCNQELEDDSKKLIKAYGNIKNSYKKEIDKINKYRKDIIEETEDILMFIEQLDIYNENINEILKQDKSQELISIKKEKFEFFFKTIKNKVENFEEINSINLDYYISIVDRYLELKDYINKKIREINDNNRDKKSKLVEINKNIKELKTKKVIADNRDILKKLIENKLIIEDIDTKLKDLTALKRNLSRLENKFSKESIMKVFSEKLYNEYKELDLHPPKQLNIKPKKNKRLCRIGNYKLSDIYSEGELKIHSLAEFFAQSQIDDFRGIYIFDDPVNSLDYERIDYVKNRIWKLVNEGNQVIVFTHNIYFLNSLISTDKGKINEVIKSDEQIYIINNTILSNKDKQIKELGKKIKKTIDRFKNMKPYEIDENEISGVYDLMSGCLESFVENKLLNGLINRYRPNIRMYSLLELKNLDKELIDKIHNLYNNTSRYGNRHSSPLETLSPTYDKLVRDYGLFQEILKVKK
ncbi:AAA family ATPase [Dethiothermospora halolimnae]|uniref:AAA family ATPase n=1 Tax=Dethiothermospora halolimnae TaxID=3114390 RepID=UPI003CCBA3DE